MKMKRPQGMGALRKKPDSWQWADGTYAVAVREMDWTLTNSLGS